MKNPFRIEQIGPATPYVWNGMTFGVWMRLLASGGFDITLNCVPRILGVTMLTPLNSGLAALSGALYRKRIEETEVVRPVFVLGHWRTGTTLLHELLDCDPRLVAPNTYQCMFPNTYLVTQRFIGPLTRAISPKKRPFDDMAFGPELPGEDEFGLLNSGFGSPYSSIAFPRQGPAGMGYLDLADLSPEERGKWEADYLRLIKGYQYGHDRRLVLKSPFHAARIPTLLRLFPDARFIYTARDPFDIYASHMRTIKVLFSNQALHNPLPPGDDWLRDYVFEVFEKIFEAYERDRALIPPGRLVESRYEELVADPKGTLRRIYREIGLGPFEPAEPAVTASLDERRGYRRNVNRVSSVDRDLIVRRWAGYLERFGYDATVA